MLNSLRCITSFTKYRLFSVHTARSMPHVVCSGISFFDYGEFCSFSTFVQKPKMRLLHAKKRQHKNEYFDISFPQICNIVVLIYRFSLFLRRKLLYTNNMIVFEISPGDVRSECMCICARLEGLLHFVK